MFEPQTVCNIEPLMYYRFILGFCQNFQHSRLTRILSKIYPIVLVVALIVKTFIFNDTATLYNKYFIGLEYSFNIVVSLVTTDKYINMYFKYYHTIDSISGAKKIYKNLEKLAIISVFYASSFRSWAFIVISRYNEAFFKGFDRSNIIELAVMYYVNDLSKITTLLCFTLLYFRTKVMKMALEATEFNDALRDRFAVNRLIQMYETIIDTFEIVAQPLKFTVRSIIMNRYYLGVQGRFRPRWLFHRKRSASWAGHIIVHEHVRRHKCTPYIPSLS
ncbi:hypothetical protein B5X24_HaOG200848 [Helicoverpa armigera]|uniref:Gustatory receptor n=1 Tax=Helicoverpa armigera TaxID=29058 RepID=A0A2W1BL02_HELAM|nr:hypothetical protein B5X24_HaOG200848 [Helicoverpa armigera]